MITAKTAAPRRDAKSKMKFLEDTIATNECLRKRDRTYPLTFPLRLRTSGPHGPFPGAVTVSSHQQTLLLAIPMGRGPTRRGAGTDRPGPAAQRRSSVCLALSSGAGNVLPQLVLLCL